MTQERGKSERNRTLRLSEEEAWALSLDLRDETWPYSDDIIVNCDLFAYMDKLPDRHFDMIVADPPYNLNKTYNGTKFAAMGEEKYEEWLRSWLHPLIGKLKSDGTLYLCSDWKSTSSMQRVLTEKMAVMNRITWQREKGRGSKSNWKNSMEDIWFAVKNPWSYKFNADAVKVRKNVIAPYRLNGEARDWEEGEEGKTRLTYASNFWDDITVPFWSMPENTGHPTQKPEKLIAKLILASTDEGDVILDPFVGSGTTAVVAKKLGRHYCGVEIEKEYALLAMKRLQIAENDKHIQGYKNGVFLERNAKK